MLLHSASAHRTPRRHLRAWACEVDDAIVCPDGLAHEPKFTVTSRLHDAVARAAADLVAAPAQLGKGVSVSGAGGAKATAFIYGGVAFLESVAAGGGAVELRGHSFALPGGSGTRREEHL